METDSQPISQWNFLQKMAFRFCALYLSFYPAQSFFPFWDDLIPFFGNKLLQIPYEIIIKPNGSGDTTYNYVQVFALLLIACMGSIFWTIVDRKRSNYDFLLYWLLVLIRYYLAFTLLNYGFAKIFKSQFPFPGFTRLLTPYGDSSPMGLAWTFMGYSTGYNYFTGGAEVLGGIFLLFRRTSTFGALFSMTVIANIVAINFFYDVPVKLFSTNLLLMALFIATPDIPRLLNFFFRNRTVASAPIKPMFYKKWMRLTHIILKILLLSWAFGTKVSGGLNIQKKYGEAAPKPPLYGLYKINAFVLDGQTLAPLTTDTVRWDLLAVNSSKYVTIKMMNDSLKYISLKADTLKKTLEVNNGLDSTILNYRFPKPNNLVLHGNLNGKPVIIDLQKLDPNRFRLVNRGFHWINEYPYNR